MTRRGSSSKLSVYLTLNSWSMAGAYVNDFSTNPNAVAVLHDHEISIASAPLVTEKVTAPSPPMNRFSNSETN